MNKTVYKVEVTRAALRRIAAHVAFLGRVSDLAAKRLYDQIFVGIKNLGNNPKSCPFYASKRFPKREIRKKIIAKRYLIIFEIHDDRKLIIVTDVQDCRQGEDKKLV